METQTASTSEPGEFLTTEQLLARLPICARTLDYWKARGLLPYIKIGRCCLYDWEQVREALMLHQRGGRR